MPIHPGCDCGVETVDADFDPGQVLDEKLLTATQEQIEQFHGFSDPTARDLGLGKTDAAGRPLSDYTDLIISRPHGEYGPTLSWRSDKFTTAAGLVA